ncbi:TetR/AcrR family transcriptional regulator [Streptomyces sp. NBC_01341]|uniref:TetR/AcrR family transcriptional regulator n=1 Tax=Streptomyces sp. NBC_01341 TaxID=2903831 RepID=UPI002E153958|nr:TetR/AcrR family transcriptional regulator [Streptomyces sp. NBC_01341]
MTFDRDAAVDRAMLVFWRQGYASTTPQGLADALSIRKGSLYNTFESKHNLFTLTLRRYGQMRAPTLRRLREEQGPVHEVLRSSLAELTGAGSHRMGCFAVNSVSELAGQDEGVTRVAESLFTDIEDASRVALERGRTRGEYTGGPDADEQARSFLTAVIGLSVLCKAGTPPDRLDQIIESTLRSM